VSANQRVKKEQLRVYEARQVIHAAKKKRTRRDQWLWTGAAAAAVALASLSLVAYNSFGPGAPEKVPDVALSEYRSWSGEMVIGGTTLTITIDGENAPQATANFISLASEGFFDETVCHRLTTESIYVLQCGDPLGAGVGGPGYTFGPVENAPANNTYTTGTIAMARAGNDAESQGSQFFIVYDDSVIPRDLAGGYTVFGQVTSGIDSLIEEFVTPGTVDGSADGRPVVVPEIRSITIR
jgi:peptidyl-prolyl cis-trans isomerase B (cyclophilin B)